ncbi:CASTOR/POLLUX-related putative ion channel [Microbispora sp. CA-102843]|uniref:CASTOR/POLLUX-related putative ion channel n=1 Tax=Microbispora sp. CA-102843 TaxID=3239952 RepID=UPI003D8FFE94
MAKGTTALIGWLALVSLVLIVAVSVLTMWLAPDEALRHDGWPGVLWLSLMHALSPGKISGDAGTAPFLAIMLGASLGGIFIVSILVGVLAAGLRGKIEELRKGRSRVIESGHTVILGWSEQLFTIVAELLKANASQRGSVIAILADRDKPAMEDAVRARVGDTGRTRLVCRTGSPTQPAALDLMSLNTARAIVVLSPEQDDPDAQVIKTLLALAKRAGEHPPAVASIAASRNMAAARLAGGPRVHLIDGDDIAARLIVQSSRQSGMSVVCMDLLNFDGCEIYLRREPSLTGRSYGEALGAYATASVLGLRTSGGVVLNPPPDRVVGASDELVVLAQDDSLIRLANGTVPVDERRIVSARAEEPAVERTLMVGWNDRAARIIGHLDGYVTSGSVLDVATDHPDAGTGLTDLANLTVNIKECDGTDRYALESLGVGVYQHVIVLSDDRYGPRQADSRTLMTLLQLRDMQAILGEKYSIASEMHDENNRSLAEVTEADDIVISDTVIGLLLAQLAENPHLAEVFGQLFDSAGAEAYPRPVENYVTTGVPVAFQTVVESALRRGETAIGYRVAARIGEPPQYGVVLNPDRSRAMTFTLGDSVIVLAEH